MKRLLMAFLCALFLMHAAAAQEESLTLQQLTYAHGSMVSTTEEAVTQEQLDAVLAAAASVTLGSGDLWQLTVIPNLDLIQELLPTYNEKGLLHEGNVAIIVSVTSDTSMDTQYEVKDNTTMIMGGMLVQQICVAAQMQGLGFKVITDSIYESSYWIYRDNIVDDEHLIKEGTPREEWLNQFAILKQKHYVADPSGEPIALMNGNNVPLKNGKLKYYLEDGTTANKKKVLYVDGYMTPCAIVLLGNSEDEPEINRADVEHVVTVWDGTGDPYPIMYGVSNSVIQGGYK